MSIAHKTEVKAIANHRVEYQLRTLLGIIGHWEEIKSTQASKPSIYIATTTPEFEKVFINGELFIKINKLKEDEHI